MGGARASQQATTADRHRLLDHLGLDAAAPRVTTGDQPSCEYVAPQRVHRQETGTRDGCLDGDSAHVAILPAALEVALS